MPVLRAGVPRYKQLAAILRARIEDGTYPPGSKLPTERDLGHEYEVGRETAHKAMLEVRRAGLAEFIHGQGTIVREQEELLPVTAPRGCRVRVRMPSDEDFERWGAIPEGVPMIVVLDPAGRFRDAYPGHLYEVPIK